MLIPPLAHFARAAGKATTGLVCSLLLAAAPLLSRADGLPAPSRTVFKCSVAGKTIYSDSPCLGAKALDIEPTRGVNKLSGRELIGADVRRERQREAYAEAIRPLTGMDARQVDAQSRRMPLTAAAQQECRSLDRAIPVGEAEEQHGDQPTLSATQRRLLEMRLRFRSLHC